MLWTQIQVLKQMVGYVIGRGGEHINNIQSNCGVRLQFQNGIFYIKPATCTSTTKKEDIICQNVKSFFLCGGGRGEGARVTP